VRQEEVYYGQDNGLEEAITGNNGLRMPSPVGGEAYGGHCSCMADVSPLLDVMGGRGRLFWPKRLLIKGGHLFSAWVGWYGD
jgi:hypothetical protein